MPEVEAKTQLASSAKMQEPAQLFWLATLVVVGLLVGGSSLGAADSLRISSIQVPSAVANSSQVVLSCHYELPRFDQLYSIKWYKNFVEFYRFQPSSEAAFSQESQWKQEFKWAGINLDLAQSNSTHVHLQRVTLASEGTYKCEVSTQLFATTSMERDMKVYVLPKQKLSIVDNALAAPPAHRQLLNHSPDQQAPGYPVKPTTTTTSLIYNINDIINLTCVAGPSRPAGQLRWLINQAPVDASSKWLTHHQTTQSHGDQGLVESRLTLAFQLQPSHLVRSNTKPQATASAGGHQLRLSCISLLAVSFSKETEVSLSGSRTSTSSLQIRRHHQTSPLSSLPLPSSLHSGGPSPALPSSSADKQTASISDQPPYRWPQPRQQSASWRYSSAGPRKRPLVQAAQSTQDAPLDNQDQAGSEEPVGQIVPARGQLHRAASWNNRELRAQADFIDLIQRASLPNELEAPQVEARSISGSEQSYDGQGGIFAATPKYSDRPLTTPHRELAPAFGGALNGDYQLNDRVQFTCKPRVIQVNEANLTKSIYSVWFLNNKEVNGANINGFDGNNFYHSTWQPEAPREDSTPSNSFNLNAHPGQASQFSNKSDRWLNNNNNKPQQTNGPLTIELTPSIFQLQELNLKCQTRVEQPLIEFEHQVVVQVPPTQFIQSNPGSHRPYPKNYIPRWNSNSGTLAKRRIHPSQESSSGCSEKDLKNSLISLPVVVLLLMSLSVLRHSVYRL